MPKILDLYCRAGGASFGYALAGFDVVGVDIETQPDYPFEFVQADAIQYLQDNGSKFDAIGINDLCQAIPPAYTEYVGKFLMGVV